MPFNKLSYITLCVFYVFSFSTCKEDHNNIAQRLKKEFKTDQQKSEAADFLLKNIDGHFAYHSRYLTPEGKDVTDFIFSYSGTSAIRHIQDSLSASLYVNRDPDNAFVTSNMFIKNINLAVNVFNNPIVKRQKWYPWSVFLEYVLPYRVGYEKIHDWRDYSYARYSSYLKTFDISDLKIQDICRLIRDEQQGTSRYLSYSHHNKLPSSVNQTVEEILKLRIPFSCEDYTIRSMYVLRSLGIPAAYERIPLWGKFNYGHAQEAVMFENGRFYPNVIGDTVPFRYQIAKMYRRTFQIQKNPAEEMKKLGEDHSNIPNNFDYNYYIDITKERTPVSNLSFLINRPLANKVVYICVYNAGKWKPVEWSSLSKQKGKVTFPDMGRKILYQLAVFSAGKIILIGDPFVLEESGNVSFLSSTQKANTELVIQRFDRSLPILPGKKYDLYRWDSGSDRWQFLQSAQSLTANVVFKGVFENAMFKVLPSEHEPKNAVRPFTYSNHTQTWW